MKCLLPSVETEKIQIAATAGVYSSEAKHSRVFRRIAKEGWHQDVCAAVGTRLQDSDVCPSQSSPQGPKRISRNARSGGNPRARNVASCRTSVVGNKSTEATRSLADTAEYLIEATEAETKSLKMRVHDLKVVRIS